MLSIRNQLGGARSNSSVAGENDQVLSSDDGHPVEVKRPRWHFWEILMTWIEDVVTPAAMQKLAEAQGVLISEIHPVPPSTLRDCC